MACVAAVMVSGCGADPGPAAQPTVAVSEPQTSVLSGPATIAAPTIIGCQELRDARLPVPPGGWSQVAALPCPITADQLTRQRAEVCRQL